MAESSTVTQKEPVAPPAKMGVGAYLESVRETIDPQIRKMFASIHKNDGVKTADEWSAIIQARLNRRVY